MTFVNATLLAGAAMVALPIILHLIMRRKPRYFEFPALRWVQQRHEKNQRRLRLRHLLLLMLRAAAICLLAFALSGPSVQFGSGVGSREAPVAAVLIFDTSPRMQYRQGNQTRLEAARELAIWLLGQLPPASQIAVVDSRGGPGAFHADILTARQRIERLETTPAARPLTETVEEAAQLLKQSELDRKEVYVFTDQSRAAWPNAAASRMQARLADLRDVGIYLIDVGVDQPTNTFLGQPRLSAQVISTSGSLVVYTEVGLISPAEATELRAVELYLLDDQRQLRRAGVETVELKPGETRQVEFRIGGLPIGAQQGVIRVLGQDGLPADDERYFTILVQKPWSLLLLAPAPADEHAYFVRNALAPDVARLRGQSRFVCDVLDQRRLLEQDLKPYSSVWLLDPAPLDPAAWKNLADFASEGRGVGIFLGRNVGRVDSFAGTAALDLLPGKPVLQARRPDGDFYFAPRDYEHPVLSVFRPVAGAVPWQAFPIFRFWQFEELAANATVILEGNDGSPLLFERPLGAGRVLTLATPLSDRPDAKAWNLLPVGVIDNAAPFVMLCHQMAEYLVGATDEMLNYTCGQTAVLNLGPAAQPRRSFLLIAPGDLRMPLSADSSGGRIAVSATEQPGNYRVVAGGGEDAVDMGFSANIAPEQTDLDRASIDELKEVFGPFAFRPPARSREQLEREVSSNRVGRELFGLTLVILAGVLAAEYLTANRFYRDAE